MYVNVDFKCFMLFFLRGVPKIYMSLLFYMFESNLNIFTFLFAFFWLGKINYFHGWGVPPFALNSAK